MVIFVQYRTVTLTVTNSFIFHPVLGDRRYIRKQSSVYILVTVGRHTHTHVFSSQFVRDYPGEPVPER